MKKLLLSTILFSLSVNFFSVEFFVEDFPESHGEIVPVTPEKLTEDLLVRQESITAYFEFITDVSGVEVYLDSTFIGRTNLTMKDVSPGIHRVKLQKTGYVTKEFFVEGESGTKKTYRIEMEGEKGLLEFEITPSDGEILVDGKPIHGKSAELPSGAHSVEVRRFGYETAKGTVYSIRNTLRKVKITLDEAKFSVSKLKFSKRRITGIATDKLRITFEVSAPGNGHIAIKNSDDAVVFQQNFPEFTSHNQEFLWDGTCNGETVPEGAYTVLLEFQPITPSGRNFKSSETITIGKNDNTFILGINTGGASMGAVSSAKLNSAHSTIFGFSLAPAMTVPGADFVAMPLNVAFVLTPADFLEFHGQIGAILTKSHSCGVLVAVSAKAGGKFPVKNSNIFLTGLLRYAFISEEFSSAISDGGLGLGILARWEMGPFGFNLQGEYTFAPVDGIFREFDGTFNFGLFAHGQGRIFGGGPWCKVAADLSGFRKLSLGGEVSATIMKSESIMKLGFAAMTENCRKWLLQSELGVTVFF